MSKRPGHIERWQSRNSKWYFHRRAGNGEITDPSQGYSTKSNCTRAIRNQFPNLKIEDVTK